jgi:peptide/nickel transport system permease protein
MWRGDDDIWYQNPDRAAPAWTNFFRKEKQPSTIVLDSEGGTAPKELIVTPDGFKEIRISFVFDYPYDGYPQDLKLFLKANYESKRPFLMYTWVTPDGRQIELGNYSMDAPEWRFSIASDEKLMRKFAGVPPQEALFADPSTADGSALQGTYELIVSALTFEPETDLDAEFVLYGQVFGLAGTDHNRRDLTLGLLWGTPVALAFGLLAAVLISFSTMAIAAIGAWYGGWPDRVIQWITEVNMVLPAFPILLMVFNYYSMRLWTILAVTVLLSIFGASVKTYRSVFLQVKESAYIEAARAYGASNLRIIGRYLVPRIVVVLIPQLIILVPTFVFLETTFAYLGMSDPLLPTWGKIVREALAYGGLSVDYYWLLEPVSLLFITAFAFLVLGYSLERIFDPRLRER